MSLKIEENFPRGGRKPTVTQKPPSFKTKNLFSTTEHKSKSKTKKPKKKKKESSNSDVIENISSSTAETLTYNKLQEGMLVLGCITNITSLAMEVELPGRIFGIVHINSVSNEFTNFIENLLTDSSITQESDLIQLNTIFKMGQFVPTKVLSITANEMRTKVSLSIKPSVINAELNHNNIKMGQLIWAAVSSILDHGYQLNNGVRNCRIFLPFNKVENDRKLVVGEPVWCIAQKCNTSASASTITTSAILKDVFSAKETGAINLHYVIPGMLFPLTISQHVKHGLEVHFNEQCTGYINESYFKNALDSATNYQEGQTILGRVLYIQPTTKLTYFTLRGLEDASAAKLKAGAILFGQVLSYAEKGVFLKLDKSNKGFVPFKRMIQSALKNPNKDIVEYVKEKYPLGSSHKCRIFDYHRLDCVYLCTVESNLIKEKIFTAEDLSIGQVVTVKVISIMDPGILVSFGRLNGFVKNLHLSNTQYSNTIKKKFSIGQSLQAKVWNIDENGNVKLTLKQTLLDSDKCLKSYEEAVVGDVYPGIVVNISKRGALFIFYADVKGYLPQSHLKDLSVQEAFYVGQVVNVVINKIDDHQITLRLDDPKQEQIYVGQFVSAVVTEKQNDHLKVRTTQNIDGIIPVTHLNQFVGKAYLGRYKVGDSLKGLLCISNQNVPVFSLKESEILKNLKQKLPILKDICVGRTLRCFYKTRNKSGIKVISPFKSICKAFIIENENIMDDDRSLQKVTFRDYQTIIAKVVSINKEKKYWELTSKLSEVFDYNLQYVIDRFQNYLDEVEKIRKYFKENNDPLADLKIGQKVECMVNGVTESACGLSLATGVKGAVSAEHYPEKLKEGKLYEGVVLWIDFTDKIAQISLRIDLVEQIKVKKGKKSTSLVNKTVFANYIAVKRDCAVAVIIKDEGKGRVVLLPTSLHENDFEPDLTFYEKQPCEIFIWSDHNNYLIGFPEDYRKKLIEKKSGEQKEKKTKKTKETEQTNEVKETKQSHKNDLNEKGKKKKELKLSRTEKRKLDETVLTLEADTSELDETNTSHTDDDGWLSEPFEIDEIQPTINKQKKSKQKKELNKKARTEVRKVNGFIELKQNENEHLSDNEEKTDFKRKTIYLSESEMSSEEFVENIDVKKSKKNKNKRKPENQNDSKPSKKLKTKNDLLHKPKSSENQSDDINQPNKKLKINSDQVKPEAVSSLKELQSNHSKVSLPGVSNFFSEASSPKEESKESDDEIDESQIREKNKKRLSASERKELARQQEEEIRKKELELLEASENPQSADQFDRLLIANPNSSQLWIQYMAYHIGNTQNDRARAVARRALDTIDLRESQEKLNVWIALLNLENRFGDKESFEKVFEEAIRCNDSYQIYIETIKMFADSQNYVEMEDKIRKAKGKFKQNPQMWTEIAKIYYKGGRFKDARNLKQGALRCVNNKKEHINLITQFAIMEFNYGEPEQGEALFETVIQSVPQRVDVWCTYIDQLVKQNKIDLARRVLDRSVCQKLSSKRIAVLFKKYKGFEEKYGTKENLERLKRLALEYNPLE